MRLLRLQNADELSLAEFPEHDVPPYAILSHRWGFDSDEVTFKDILETTGKDKIGYQKVVSCGKQAAKDGYTYFWVDTCCIDKSSSAELSEAINSMWRWYRNCNVCYAYLSDVASHISGAEQDEALAVSKWFTRGWTLQELLAPTNLVLFDAAWNIIGTKAQLADRISNITRIDRYYLSGDSIFKASFAERMSWASARSTKRSEDIAYCLLGIFEINMPLLYGEGPNAFRRLQEEIMKQSTDLSLLAWDATYGTLEIPWRLKSGTEDQILRGSEDDAWCLHSAGALLAPSPVYFKNCADIVLSDDVMPVNHHTITNRGLHIELPVLRRPGEVLAILNCRRASDYLSDVALYLRQDPSGNDQYWRESGRTTTVPTAYRSRAVFQSMYITSIDARQKERVSQFLAAFDQVKSRDLDAKETRELDSLLDMVMRPSSGDPGILDRSPSARMPKFDGCVIRGLPNGYVVSQVYPPSSWSPQTRCIAGGNLPSNETWKSPRLVIIRTDNFPAIAFMIHRRRFLWREVRVARFLPINPISPTGEDDIERLYWQWESSQLTKLPWCQKIWSQSVVLRTTPMLVRNTQVTALDVVMYTGWQIELIKAAERIRYCGHFIAFEYSLTRNWDWDLAHPLLYLAVVLVHMFLRFNWKPTGMECSSSYFYAISFPLEICHILHMLAHLYDCLLAINSRSLDWAFTSWEPGTEHLKFPLRLIARGYGPVIFHTMWVSLIWGYSRPDPCVWHESVMASFLFLGLYGVARFAK